MKWPRIIERQISYFRAERAKRQDEDASTKIDRSIKRATWAMTIITAANLVLFYFQWTDSQASGAKADANVASALTLAGRSADAAEKAAAAADKGAAASAALAGVAEKALDESKRANLQTAGHMDRTLRESRDQFELENRATLLPVSFANPDLTAKHPTFRVVFKNSGQVAASGLQYEYAISVVSQKRPGKPRKPIRGGGYQVAPDGNWNLELIDTDQVKPELLTLIDDGTLNLFYFGHVRYKDGFGYCRLTRFCGIYFKIPDGPAAMHPCDGDDLNSEESCD